MTACHDVPQRTGASGMKICLLEPQSRGSLATSVLACWWRDGASAKRIWRSRNCAGPAGSGPGGLVRGAHVSAGQADCLKTAEGHDAPLVGGAAQRDGSAH